jgi:DNA repair/transcription protein MET18/MMS19
LYAVTLWDSVKFEILQAQEDDLAQESLNILAAMAVTLSQGSSDGLLTLLKPVIKECNEHLEDAPTKQSEAANRMLFVIASGSWEASNLAITGVLPHLFTLYQSTEDMPKRRSLIQTLSKLIEASCQSFGDWTTSPYQLQMKDNANSVRFGLASENALHKFSKQALEILIYGLSSVRVEDVSYRLALLQASQQLVRAREILNDSEISQIIRLLNNIILEEEPYGKDEVRITATTTLDEIARQKPHLIIEQSFPSFLSKIPDSDIGHDGKHIPILEAFAKIGVENKIFNTVVVRLKNKLNTAIHNSASSDYIQAILSALLYTVSNTTTSLVGSDTACPFYDDLVLPLLRQIPSSLQPDQQHDMVFGLMGCICNEILRQQSSNFQSTISQIIYNRSVGRSEDEGLPDPNMSRAEGRYLIISTSLLAAFRRDVPLPYSTSTLLTRLIQVTKVENLTPGSRAAAIQQIGLLVNKFLSISELKSVLAPKIEELKLDPSSIPVVFAILKALVFRNAPLLSSIFPSLVKRLSDEKSGPSIAHGFSTLLQPDEILTKENHCIISPLHKQKAFAMLVPDIAQGVRQTQPEQKMNYLVALSGILQWLPFTIIEPEISSLSPLLLQTLDITGEYDIKIGTIEMLNLILKEKGQELEEHISSIVTRLLNLASSYNNPPRIRGNALQCLALLPAKLRLEVVIPYRKQVVKKLTDAVDDRRRTVRAEAVRCRTKWIELDDVGSGNQDEDD